MTHKKQFTLIELLVVIAIIAVLATMLFPVVGSMKEKAYQSTCQNNLSQLGKAVMMYQNDHNGSYPFEEDTKNGGEKHALNFIWLRLAKDSRDPGIYVCPSCTQTANAAENIEKKKTSKSYKDFSSVKSLLTDACTNTYDASSYCYFTGEVTTSGSVQKMGTMSTSSGLISDGWRTDGKSDEAEEEEKTSKNMGWSHDDNGRYLRCDNSVQGKVTTGTDYWSNHVGGNKNCKENNDCFCLQK